MKLAAMLKSLDRVYVRLLQPPVQFNYTKGDLFFDCFVSIKTENATKLIIANNVGKICALLFNLSASVCK